jgi:polysaccharide pyruvyl transferase WcaK-like protein
MRENYYIALHGAKKNSGDFLIRDRALKLLRSFRKDRDILEFERWKHFDDSLDVLNNAKAIILMGGPSLRSNIYPRVYPLTKDLNRLTTPVFMLGGGCSVLPAFSSTIKSFNFSSPSLDFLSRCEGISVRDILSKQILEDQGIRHTSMVGCPAWYDLDHINKDMILPDDPANIVLSTPQNEINFPQFISLAKTIREKFPHAKITATFNRGIAKDDHTSSHENKYMTKFFHQIQQMNIEVEDLSYGIEKMEDLSQADLHIGYRLHSHILFISSRKPSYLIAEDSRAYGHCITLQLPIFHALEKTRAYYIGEAISYKNIKKIIRKHFSTYQSSTQMLQRFLQCLEFDLSTNFSTFQGVPQKLRGHFNTMKTFINALP